MEQRRLGRTGYKVTTLTIGGAGIGFVPDPQEGVKAFEFALEKGLNMLDIAPSYGDAEVRAGPLVRKYRSRLVTGLLRLGELVNVGGNRTAGYGVITVTPRERRAPEEASGAEEE